MHPKEHLYKLRWTCEEKVEAVMSRHNQSIANKLFMAEVARLCESIEGSINATPPQQICTKT